MLVSVYKRLIVIHSRKERLLSSDRMHGRMERLIDELDVHASYNIYVMILNFLNEVKMLDGFLF